MCLHPINISTIGRSLLLAAALNSGHPARAAEAPAPGEVAAINSLAEGVTTFTVITDAGYVSFQVGSDWKVLAVRSRMPAAAMTFQIVDAADAGTPDSTNVVVGLYETGSAAADVALAHLGSPLGGSVPANTTRGSWAIVTQDAKQGATTYTVIDATTPTADVRVSVRLAWPHLPDHPRSHESEMRALFFRLLDSVKGGIGPYKVHDNEVVRGPDWYHQQLPNNSMKP